MNTEVLAREFQMYANHHCKGIRVCAKSFGLTINDRVAITAADGLAILKQEIRKVEAEREEQRLSSIYP